MNQCGKMCSNRLGTTVLVSGFPLALLNGATSLLLDGQWRSGGTELAVVDKYTLQPAQRHDILVLNLREGT